MEDKIRCLHTLYEENEMPCICFKEDYKILWLNKKAIETFPEIPENASLCEVFPDFSFSRLILDNNASFKFYNNENNTDFFEIISFPQSDKATLYVAIYRKTENFNLNNIPSEHRDIKILSSYIRKRLSSIFNLSELLTERFEAQKDYESSHYIKDIERNCRLLLKLSSNFDTYHTISDELSIYKTETDFHMFFIPLMNKVESVLAPTNLTFIFDPDYQNGIIDLDKNLFATAILNIISTSYLFTKESGILLCKTEFFNNHMILTLEDNTTDYNSITSANPSETSELDATGEPYAIKKMYYDILKTTVKLHGGKCTITNKNPGIKINIHLNSKLIDTNLLASSSTYNSKLRLNSKLGIVDVMLSDVTY